MQKKEEGVVGKLEKFEYEGILKFMENKPFIAQKKKIAPRS